MWVRGGGSFREAGVLVATGLFATLLVVVISTVHDTVHDAAHLPPPPALQSPAEPQHARTQGDTCPYTLPLSYPSSCTAPTPSMSKHVPLKAIETATVPCQFNSTKACALGPAPASPSSLAR